MKMKFKMAFVVLIQFVIIFALFTSIKNIEYAVIKNEMKTNVDIPGIFDSGNVLNKVKIEETGKVETNNAQKTKEAEKQQKLIEEQKKKEENERQTKEERAKAKDIEIMPNTTKAKLTSMKESGAKTIEYYTKEYRNSPLYGTIAYILATIAWLSIPILIILLIVSYTYDSIIGIKNRQLYNKGRIIRKHAITFFFASWIMPLVFALVVKGWGN